MERIKGGRNVDARELMLFVNDKFATGHDWRSEWAEAKRETVVYYSTRMLYSRKY